MYEEKILVTSNDVDNHFETKVSALFRYMQQVATNHSEILGIGKSATSDQGMIWVITRFKVIIHKYPVLNETITVKTDPYNRMMFIFPRSFHIYNEAGELLVSALSSWVVIGLRDRKIIVNPFPELKIDESDIIKDVSTPEKVNAFDLNFVEERKVRFNDIDLNGHLNNTKYIDYLIDIHDSSFYDQYKLKTITINYEKEIKDKDIVKLYSNNQIDELIKGEVNSETCFAAHLEFIKR